MLKKIGKNEKGKSISDRLGIDEKTDKTSLKDLTRNDGSEDPGSELDTEFSKATDKSQQRTGQIDSRNNMAEENNDTTASQPSSGTSPKGEELDAFTNKASKKQKLEKTHPKPQADETISPNLNSENDI